MAVVSLASAESRYATAKKALELVEEDLAAALAGKSRVLIKPNFVTVRRQLAATHVDAVRALLDVLLHHHPGPFTIAEGTSSGPTALSFRFYGFTDLRKDYPVELVNLNRDKTLNVQGFDRMLRPIDLPVARSVLESDLRISVALLKTHDAVLATMSLKNIAVGSISGVLARQKIHQGPRAINLTIYKLLQAVRPDFALVDGWEAMEGNGPTGGTPVPMRVAIAGSDAVAVDTVGAYLMGFDPGEIGYLKYCREGGVGTGDLDEIEVAGERPEDRRRVFRRHDGWERQATWEEPSYRELLGLA